jgi:cobalt-zinc-cadmium efflux system outer membrane protein
MMWELRRVGPAAALLSAACALAEPAPLRPAADIAAERPSLAEIGIDWNVGLTPDEAARLAALRNPELRAAREARGEAAAELQMAGLLSDLVLGGDVLHPTSGPGVSDLVTAYGLSLSVDTASLVTRSSRIDEAAAKAESTDLGLAWQEWQVAQAARLEAVRLGRLRRRLEVARAEIEFLEGTTASLERAVATGDATLQGLGVQRAALEAARQVRRELESAEATSLSTLLAELGLAPDQPLVVAESVALASAAPPPEFIGGCLARRLDLEALRRGYDAQEAALRQAVLEQLPAISVGLTSSRDESQIRFLGGFVSATLPAFDRARGRVALAEATRARLAREFEARAFDAQRELAALARALELDRDHLAEVERALPQLAQLEASERGAANRGDLDRVSYQAVRTSLFELRLLQEALAQAQLETAIGLELACGGPLQQVSEAAP